MPSHPLTLRRSVALVVAVAITASACGDDPPARSDVLASTADDPIVIGYERFATEADELVAAITELCDAPDEAALATARVALADARTGWKSTEAMWVGPVMDRRSWAVIDWPIDVDEIEDLIADESIVLDGDRLARRVGADQRGLGGIEYVLGLDGPDGTTSDPASVLAGFDDSRRCEYLLAAADVVGMEADLLLVDWTDGTDDEPPYREVLAEVDGTGLDSLVNDSLFLLEAMSDAELGIALGAMEGPADVDVIVEGPLGYGVADLRDRLAGLRLVLVGDGENEGIGPLLDDDLVARLTEQIDAADAAIVAIDPPLKAAVVDSPDTVAAARDALNELQVTVSTEVVGALGVTIGFSDADGDSAG